MQLEKLGCVSFLYHHVTDCSNIAIVKTKFQANRAVLEPSRALRGFADCKRFIPVATVGFKLTTLQWRGWAIAALFGALWLKRKEGMMALRMSAFRLRDRIGESAAGFGRGADRYRCCPTSTHVRSPISDDVAPRAHECFETTSPLVVSSISPRRPAHSRVGVEVSVTTN